MLCEPIRAAPGADLSPAAFAKARLAIFPEALTPEITAAALDLLDSARWSPDTTAGRAFSFDVAASPEANDLLHSALAWLVPSVHALLPGPAALQLEPKRLVEGSRFPWHQDHTRGQLLGVSLVLRAPQAGGVFEQRLKWNRGAAQRVVPAAGALHVFDVTDPRLVHRVTPVTGERIAFAGWLVSPQPRR